MPFENVGNDPANEPFSDGLTEELNDRLSRTPGVKVVARSVMFQYKGRAMDLKQVGRELGVRYVLEGSVRRVGNRVRVEIEVPAGFNSLSGEVAIRPRRFRVYPTLV